MQYIVIDFEATNDTIDFPEIIQIGAKRLKTEWVPTFCDGVYNFKETIILDDAFNAFIKPVYTRLTKKISKLTGITREMLSEAKLFDDVLKEFKTWVGQEETVFLAWSENDFEMFKENCKRFCMPTYWFTSRYLDIQLVFETSCQLNYKVKLIDAMKMSKLDFAGTQHSAVADALNTARLFLANMEESYEKNQ